MCPDKKTQPAARHLNDAPGAGSSRPPVAVRLVVFCDQLTKIGNEVKLMGLEAHQSVDLMSALIVQSLAQDEWPTGGSLRGQGRDVPLPDHGRIPTKGSGPIVRSPYLDADEAAAYLKITRKSLYGIVERGHLEPLRGPRNRYRFTVAMLDDYLARGSRK